MNGPMIIRVMPDGSIKIETDKVTPAAHVRAERFIAEVIDKLGGKVERKSRHGHHHHGHGDHSHDHNGDHVHQ